MLFRSKLFDHLTVSEHLRFVAELYRVADWKARAEVLLTQFELVEKRATLAAELSRGMRQKVAICCGYLHQPKAIMLDEPLTGLDPRGIRNIKESVRRRAGGGTAFLLSSHLLELVEALADRVLILHHGRKRAFGTLEEVRAAATLHIDAKLEDVFFAITK